jgi:hypothetical protein
VRKGRRAGGKRERHGLSTGGRGLLNRVAGTEAFMKRGVHEEVWLQGAHLSGSIGRQGVV